MALTFVPDPPATSSGLRFVPDEDPLAKINPLFDAAATGLSGAVSGVAKGASGLVNDVTGANVKPFNDFIDKYSYKPHTPEVQAATKAIGDVYNKADEAVTGGMNALNDKAEQGAEAVGGDTARDALRSAGDFAAGNIKTLGDAEAASPIFGAAKGLAGAAVGGAKEGAARAPAIVAELRQRGLKMRPSDVSAITPGGKTIAGAKTLESAADSSAMGAQYNTHNSQMYQDAAARALKTDLYANGGDGTFTPAKIAELEKPHKAVYGEMADLPGLGNTAEYDAALKGITDKGMGTDAAYDLAKAKNDYATLGDSESVVRDVMAIRKKASKLIQNDDPAKVELGYALQKISGAMEDELTRRAMAAARQTGDYQLPQRFIQSRQELSKIHTVEDAVHAGMIDPQKIRRAAAAGVPVHLDPDLDFIAKGAEYAENVSKHPVKFAEAAQRAAKEEGIGGLVTRGIGKVTRTLGAGKALNFYQRALGKEGIVPRPEVITPPGKNLARVEGGTYPPNDLYRPIGDLMPDDEPGVSTRRFGPEAYGSQSLPGAPARIPGVNYEPPPPRGPHSLAEGPQNAAVRQHPGNPPLHSELPPPLALTEFPTMPGVAGEGAPLHQVLVNPTKLRATNRGGERPGPVKVFRKQPDSQVTLAPNQRNPKPTVAQKRGQRLEDKLK